MAYKLGYPEVLVFRYSEGAKSFHVMSDINLLIQTTANAGY